MLEKALEHHRQGEHSQAEIIYRELLGQEPDNFEVLHLLGLLKQAQGDTEQALDLVEKAIDLQPEGATFYLSLGSILNQRGDVPGAIANVEKALSLNANLPEAHNTLGYLQMLQGDLTEAHKTLNMALRLKPDDVGALINMGNVFLAQGETANATRYFQEALQLNPEAIAARASLGTAFLAQGAAGLAEQCFKTCLEQQPGSIKLKALLAQAKIMSGLTDEARVTLGNLVDEPPQQFELIKALAMLAEAEERLTQASQLFQQALMIKRGDGSTLEQLGNVLIKRGEYAAAIQCLRKAKNLPGVTDELPLQLATALFATGQAEQALKELPADGLKARLLRADICYQQGMLDEAEQASQQTVKSDADASRAHLLLTRIQLDRGEPEKALALLDDQASDAILSQAPEYHALKAMALDSLERYADAAKAFISTEQLANPKPPALCQSIIQLQETESWPTEPMDGTWAEPCFLVGLPESGITDIIPALNQLSSMEVLIDRAGKDERNDFITNLKDTPTQGWNESAIGLARRRYWHALRRAQTKETKPVIALDWLPTDCFDPLAIARIFPNARILVVYRHPGDHLLQASTQGWQIQLASGLIDLQDFYQISFQAQDALALRFSWLDFAKLLNGDYAALSDFTAETGASLDGLSDILAEVTKRPPHQQGYWPEGHWRHYEHLLDLPATEIEDLAEKLDQRK